MAAPSPIQIIAWALVLLFGMGACTMEPDYLGYEVNEEGAESTGGTQAGTQSDEAGPEGPRRRSIRKRCKRLAREVYSDCRQGCVKGDKMCKQRCQREAREFMRRCIKELKKAKKNGSNDVDDDDDAAEKS